MEPWLQLSLLALLALLDGVEGREEGGEEDGGMMIGGVEASGMEVFGGARRLAGGMGMEGIQGGREGKI